MGVMLTCAICESTLLETGVVMRKKARMAAAMATALRIHAMRMLMVSLSSSFDWSMANTLAVGSSSSLTGCFWVTAGRGSCSMVSGVSFFISKAASP